jgi:heptosyltransferase-2
MSERPERILVHAPSWIGDLVMATAAFAALRETFAQSHITLLLKPGRDRVVAGGDYFDVTVRDRSAGSLRRVLSTAAELRRRRFDLAVLFADSLRARLLASLAGIPRRVGYRRNLGGWLLTDAVGYPGARGAKVPEPMPVRFERLVRAVGAPPQGSLRPRLVVTADEVERARLRRHRLGIGEREPLIGLNPGASFGASKIWPPASFARLADLLAERFGVRSLILTGPGEEAIARAILAAARSRPIWTGDDVIPLDELKAVVRGLRLLVTTDTGPRHYAVAFRVPAVVLMGPTDRRYTEIHLDETIVIQKKLPCSPCHLKTCPIDHRCMRWITPEEVLAAAETLAREHQAFESAP